MPGRPLPHSASESDPQVTAAPSERVLGISYPPHGFLEECSENACFRKLGITVPSRVAFKAVHAWVARKREVPFRMAETSHGCAVRSGGSVAAFDYWFCNNRLVWPSCTTPPSFWTESPACRWAFQWRLAGNSLLGPGSDSPVGVRHMQSALCGNSALSHIGSQACCSLWLSYFRAKD